MQDIKVTHEITEEEVHVGEKKEIIKDGDLVDTSLEEEINDFKKAVEDLNMKKMIEKDESMSDMEREVLINSIDEDGNFRFDQVMKNTITATIKTQFNDEKTGLKLLLPYFYPTDKESIKHPIELLDVEVDGITYYLRDEFKRLALSVEGDKVYNLYLTDPSKMHTALEGKTIMKDEKDVKLDTFIEYLNILNYLEQILDEEFGKFATEKAYKTAINEVYGKFLNDDKEIDRLKSDIEKVKSNGKNDKTLKTDYKNLKGYFFKKMSGHKKNVPLGLSKDFSELLDTLADLFIFTYERTVLGVNTELESHIKDINEGKYYIMSENFINRIKYFIVSDLLNTYKEKSKRWTFVSIESELYNKSVEKSYLYEVFEQICRKIAVKSKGDLIKSRPIGDKPEETQPNVSDEVRDKLRKEIEDNMTSIEEDDIDG